MYIMMTFIFPEPSFPAEFASLCEIGPQRGVSSQFFHALNAACHGLRATPRVLRRAPVALAVLGALSFCWCESAASASRPGP